jgi:YidC/Oxa1 family membrane protein insertase
VGFWDIIFINPMINALIVLSRIFFDSFGLAIILFTILVRLATLPLTMRQLASSRKMTELGPRIQELQKKYKDPKRRQEETMKLYREAGVNPIGCLGPMIIQFPIWIALYRVISLTAAGTPERTVELSHRLYSFSFIQGAVPLPTKFLWLDLGRQDPFYILVALVFVTTWLQTKLSVNVTPGQTAQQQQTTKMLLWMMPVMFAWFTLTVPSGLAVYWVATNVIGIVMNWFAYGWTKRSWREIFVDPNQGTGGTPARRTPRAPRPGSTPALVDGDDTTATKRSDNGARDKRTADGQPGSKRKDRGGGDRQSTPAARARPESGRRRRR